jgi:hypothetical protein
VSCWSRREPPDRRRISVGDEPVGELFASPAPLEVFEVALGLFVAKRIVVAAAEGRLRSMEDKALYALRVRDRQHHGERPSLAPVRSRALVRGPLHPGPRAHPPSAHRAWGRQACGPTCRCHVVEANDARERRHSLEPAHPARLSPIEAEMVTQPGIISRSCGPSPTTDVHVAAARVVNRGSHRWLSPVMLYVQPAVTTEVGTPVERWPCRS